MGRRKMDSELHRIKLETGTVYQTSKGGNYYFRYQINGERKCVSLKTANQEEAIRKAKELLPTVQATNLEVIATHVKVARKLATQTRRIAFTAEQEEQLRAVLDDPRFHLINKEEIKVIFYIGMYTGQRLKDCVLLQWQNVDLVHRRIQVKQFKTGKEVSIPIAPPLLQVLEEAKERRIDAYVSPNVAQRYKQTNQQGKCIGDGLVNIDVMRVIRWIGVETSVAVEGRKRKTTVLGFHSLRHSFASFCAEAGIPKAVVVSILGANSDIIDSFYTHVGEEAQRAAIDAISGIKSTNHAETRIHNALAYIEQLQDKTSEILTIKRILQE